MDSGQNVKRVCKKITLHLNNIFQSAPFLAQSAPFLAQSAPFLVQSAPFLARERTCLHLILVSQPPFTSHPLPPPPPRGRGGDEYGLPSCPLNMGRGGQGSATTCCFTWPLPPSICPPPSVVQGLCGEGDMGQTDFRDNGRRGGTQLFMQSPSRSSYNKSSLWSQS